MEVGRVAMQNSKLGKLFNAIQVTKGIERDVQFPQIRAFFWQTTTDPSKTLVLNSAFRRIVSVQCFAYTLTIEFATIPAVMSGRQIGHLQA